MQGSGFWARGGCLKFRVQVDTCDKQAYLEPENGSTKGQSPPRPKEKAAWQGLVPYPDMIQLSSRGVCISGGDWGIALLVELLITRTSWKELLY